MMKNDATIRLKINAEPDSKLEKAVRQLLNESELNRKRLREAFNKKIEKQHKKIERRGL